MRTMSRDRLEGTCTSMSDRDETREGLEPSGRSGSSVSDLDARGGQGRDDAIEGRRDRIGDGRVSTRRARTRERTRMTCTPRCLLSQRARRGSRTRGRTRRGRSRAGAIGRSRGGAPKTALTRISRQICRESVVRARVAGGFVSQRLSWTRSRDARVDLDASSPLGERPRASGRRREKQVRRLSREDDDDDDDPGRERTARDLRRRWGLHRSSRAA
jgi:hypothetical protein